MTVFWLPSPAAAVLLSAAELDLLAHAVELNAKFSDPVGLADLRKAEMRADDLRQRAAQIREREQVR